MEAYNSEGQFKVIRGHPRSNGIPLFFGHETWWMESCLDATNSKGQFKILPTTSDLDQVYCT